VFVSCDHCFAEYELDDAKIPAGGARLRCKKCDHYFVIVPSETSDLQSADDLAHDALAAEVPDEADLDPERGSALEENFDLDGDSDRGSGLEEGFDLDGDSDRGSGLEDSFDLDGDSERESSVEEGFDLDGESDWEFNDQVEISEPEVGEEASESAFEQDGDWVDLSTAEDVVDDLFGPAGAIDTDAATAVDDLLGEIDTAAYKALTGTTRRTTVPLMELLDELHITRRQGDIRILRRG